MTSDGLGEMFEGDSADTCAKKNPQMTIGGQAEGLVWADPGARTPIGERNMQHDLKCVEIKNKIRGLWVNDVILFGPVLKLSNQVNSNQIMLLLCMEWMIMLWRKLLQGSLNKGIPGLLQFEGFQALVVPTHVPED